MRIVLANYRYYTSGGPEVYMFNVKELLEDAGHEVIPFSVASPLNEPTEYSSYFPLGKSESGDAYYENVRKTPKNTYRLLSCAFFNKDAYIKLRKLIQDVKPDVVYVLQQINALSPSVFKAAHDEGVRVVHRLSDFNMMCPRSDFLCNGEICTACINGDYSKAMAKKCCHNSKATTAVRVASMKYHAERRLFDYVDAFVCPTAFTAQKLSESGIPKEKISVIPTFTWLPEPTSASSEGYVLYLGRISPEKGIEELLEAIAGLPNVKLKMTGRIDDDYSRHIERVVNETLLSDQVEFVGFVQGKEKSALIDGATCIACPSVWFENMPNAVIEAYAHAKPVVCFDVGCMPELIEDGVTGLVAPLGNAQKLGEAVGALLADSEKCRTMGETAYLRCLDQFSSEVHLRELIKVLQGQRQAAGQ